MNRDPVRRFLELYQLLHHSLRQRAVQVGSAAVSAHQATILAQLDSSDPRSVGELAANMGVALPTMSLLVDRLVRGGLIRRARAAEDGRRVELRLTGRGVKLAARASLLDVERVRLLLASVDPSTRTDGLDALASLADAAKRLNQETPVNQPSRASA